MQIVQIPKIDAGNTQRHQYCWITMELLGEYLGEGKLSTLSSTDILNCLKLCLCICTKAIDCNNYGNAVLVEVVYVSLTTALGLSPA